MNFWQKSEIFYLFINTPFIWYQFHRVSRIVGGVCENLPNMVPASYVLKHKTWNSVLKGFMNRWLWNWTWNLEIQNSESNMADQNKKVNWFGCNLVLGEGGGGGGYYADYKLELKIRKF